MPEIDGEYAEHERRPNGYITRPQFWALDEACKPLRATFPDYGPYLVGSVMERPTFRDVDVRLILSDEHYDRLSDNEWGLLGFVTSRHLAAVTGLPIDFQFQRQTDGNAAYGDKWRTPLGMRGEGYWEGDQRPAERVVKLPGPEAHVHDWQVEYLPDPMSAGSVVRSGSLFCACGATKEDQ